MVIGDIAIITAIGADYCCIIYGISKSEANRLLEIVCLMIMGIYNYIYQINLYQKSSL